MKLGALRRKTGKTQAEIAQLLGVTPQAYSNYERGEREPNRDMLIKLAEIFGVTMDYLLDIDTPAPPKGVKIPVLGKVQAGIPLEAIEEIIDYEEISTAMAAQGEFLGLVIRGESMMPRMVDGDVVIVRKQPDVDTGDIAVVLVNGNEATVKKIRKSENGITLIPLNPAFDPMFYNNEEIEKYPVEIIGKVVELRGKF